MVVVVILFCSTSIFSGEICKVFVNNKSLYPRRSSSLKINIYNDKYYICKDKYYFYNDRFFINMPSYYYLYLYLSVI